MFFKKIIYIFFITLCLIFCSIPSSFCAKNSLVLEKISGNLEFDTVGNYNANGKEQIIALIDDEDGEGGTFYTLAKNGEIVATKKYETNDEVYDSIEYKTMFFSDNTVINEYPMFKLIQDTDPANAGKYAVFKYISSEDTTGSKITDYKYFNPNGSHDSYIYVDTNAAEQIIGLVIDSTPKYVEYINGNGTVLIPSSSQFVANSNNKAEFYNYEYGSILVRDESGKAGLVNKNGEEIIPLTSGFSNILPLSNDFKVIFTSFHTDPNIGYITDYTGNKLSNKSYSYAALQNNNLIYVYKYGLSINDSVVDVFDTTGKILFDDKFSNLTQLDTNNLYTFTKINETGIRFMDKDFNELPDMYIENAYSAQSISDITKTPNDDLYYSVTLLNTTQDINLYNYTETIYKITEVINPDTSGSFNFVFVGIGTLVITSGIIICKKYRI